MARARSDSRESRIRELLRFVFEAEYRYAGGPCRMPAGTGAETWCGIYDKYPNEALSAFEQRGGTVVDSYSGEQKKYCAIRLVRDHSSPEPSREFTAALSKIVPGLYDIAVHPLGTGYSHTLNAIDALLEEPVFGVSRVERPDPDQMCRLAAAPLRMSSRRREAT